MRKVLFANRGEVAVRIARACRDADLASVAVYASPERAAVHVRVADVAVCLADSYGGVLGLPVTFLIGRDGNIQNKYLGATDMATVEQLARDPNRDVRVHVIKLLAEQVFPALGG